MNISPKNAGLMAWMLLTGAAVAPSNAQEAETAPSSEVATERDAAEQDLAEQDLAEQEAAQQDRVAQNADEERPSTDAREQAREGSGEPAEPALERRRNRGNEAQRARERRSESSHKSSPR